MTPSLRGQALRILSVLFPISGASKGYEEELLGYTARSRQQSLDRRSASTAERKQSTKPSQEAPEVKKNDSTEERKRPPTAPRRKGKNK